MSIQLGSIEMAWTQSYTAELEEHYAYSFIEPTPVQSPRLLAWCDEMAATLNLPPLGQMSDLARQQMAQLLGGNQSAHGIRPWATRYGGHQFGNWAGQLGDGRAIFIGEVNGYELQLKGAGRTPYSRGGDGRAVLRSSIREYIASEAMHALGVPTTRALSLVGTGEPVERDMFYDGHPRNEPGAIVCRVSPSFVRFGHFEIHAAHGELRPLRMLLQRTIKQHFKSLMDLDYQSDSIPLENLKRFLGEVAERTAQLMVHWHRVGFTHGVMNTDNMSILGLTIDYGPFGWVEPYDPLWTPNTTDFHYRRYGFGQQSTIARWNLLRLAESLCPLLHSDFNSLAGPSREQLISRARELIETTLEVYDRAWQTAFRKMSLSKLGLTWNESDSKLSSRRPDMSEWQTQAWPLAEKLWDLLPELNVDYTLFFAFLTDWRQKASVSHGPDFSHSIELPDTLLYAPMTESKRSLWNKWWLEYQQTLSRLPAELNSDAVAKMKTQNPMVVPRNYLLQKVIDAAEADDLAPLERLLRVLRSPYERPDSNSDREFAWMQKRPDWAANKAGCSMLSCSS